MKIENVLAVMVAVLASGLTALSQTNNQAEKGITQLPPPPSTNQPLPVVEPLPPALPADRTVSYAPLVGPEAASNNIPFIDEVNPLITLEGSDLTDAIRGLALEAGLNIQFDPSLLVDKEGHSIPPPKVTEKWKNLTAMQALRALLDNWGWQLTWDPRTKVGRVTKKDLAAKEPLILTVIQLRYGNPTNIFKEVQDTLSPGSAIIPDVRTHQLILRTTEKELPGV